MAGFRAASQPSAGDAAFRQARSPQQQYLLDIVGLVSNSLMTDSSAGAMWFFAASLVLSCLLVIALPAKLVNR